MSATQPLGPLMHSFFADHLITVKGLQPASVRSYRDTMRLLLRFVAADKGTKITRLNVGDLTFERMVGFLRHLEHDRGNHTRTRNQRLAALHTLFDYIAGRDPEMLAVCQRVAAVPMKRAAPAETHFLERDEVESLLRGLPRDGRLALRDRTLLLFIYNTGARAQEAADVRVEHLDLGKRPLARLHGKGDKWRTCPLWRQTAQLLGSLLESFGPPPTPQSAVFAAHGQALTRFGIYKIVRRHAAGLDDARTDRRVSPTPSVTPRPSTCWRPASKSTSSEAGSATPTSPPPTATPRSTPGPRSRPFERPSHRVLRRGPAPGPSGSPTNRCSTGSPRSERYVAGIRHAQPLAPTITATPPAPGT